MINERDCYVLLTTELQEQNMRPNLHKLEIKVNQRHRGDLSDLRDCNYSCNTNCASFRPCIGLTFNKILLCSRIQTSILTTQMKKQRPDW